MDASYLKKNVGGALTEALTSMSVQNPDDKVEYIGRFLIEYVNRRKNIQRNHKEIAVLEARASIEIEQENKAKVIRDNIQMDESIRKQQYADFLGELKSKKSKDDVMDCALNFIAKYFSIPAAYMAVRKVSGEKETLNYIAASKGQEFVIGKKIQKVIEEGDDLPPRQGFTFDAFKIPEPPADAVEEEVDENAPPKPPPKPVPLVIDNVMRDKRCCFFGIPKLGAFVAVPLLYQTAIHESGCLPGEGGSAEASQPPADGEAPSEEAKEVPAAPAFNIAKISQEFIIGMDTIGKYRSFKPDEIKITEEIGSAVLAAFSALDDVDVESQIAFLTAAKNTTGPIAEGLAKLPEAEAAELANVGAELAAPVDPPADGAEPVAPPESLKPYRETVAICKVWSTAMGDESLASAVNGLKDHILPAPQAVANLVYAICCLIGTPEKSVRDACGDITWEAVRLGGIPSLASKISSYDPTSKLTIAKDASLSSIKGFCESNNVFDASQFPPHIPVIGALANWFQRALAAREAAILYFGEVKQELLEEF